MERKRINRLEVVLFIQLSKIYVNKLGLMPVNI